MDPKTKKRLRLRRSITLAAALLVALAAAPSFAQPPPREHAVAVVAHFLELSEEQVAALVASRQAAADAIAPLAAERSDFEEALGALLQTDDPDPAEVGGLVLAIRDLTAQIRAIQAQAAAEFEAVLDEDQLRRLAAARRAARLQPVVRAFRTLGLI